MQERWWEQKAEKVQFNTDTNKSKMLYSAINAIYDPSRNGTAPPPPPPSHHLMSADGSAIVKDKE